MIGARVRITMLAQLMDFAAAVGSPPYADAPESLARFKQIADEAQALVEGSGLTDTVTRGFRMGPHPTLLDRVEEMLHAIRSMPATAGVEDKLLVALPANKVPLVVPGGLTSGVNIAYALKISLCATICYILYHALDYPGISTCVITVFITGLTTTGAIKQKFALRFAGSLIGGLVFGLGAAVFLFPSMDSITSLVVLIAAIAFIAGWCSLGRRYSYVGMQIAFSFYLVAFEGFSAPTQLAPPRDRLIGILLALVVMWIVFDQIWPVRTVTAMRRALAVVLQDGAKLFRLPEDAKRHEGVATEADALRDHVGKTVAALRTMNDAVEYEFGTHRESHIQLSQSILRAALTAVALFWSQMPLLYHKRDRDLLSEPRLAALRHEFASVMDRMADAVAQDKTPVAPDASQFLDLSPFDHPRYKEFAQSALTRLRELQDHVQQIHGLIQDSEAVD